MLSRKYLVLLAGGTLAFATWAGYRMECRVMDSAGNKPVTFESVVRRVTAPKARTEKIDKLNELRHRAGRSEPSPDEIAAAWKIIRAMGVEDVKAYLEEIPMEPRRDVNETLVCMLFSRWGQLDPEAAAELANQAPYKDRYTFMMAVVTSWADRDPEGALRGTGKLGLGPFLQNTAGKAVGRMLVQKDPATALDRAIAEFPAAVNGVATALAQQPGETEESRRAIMLRLVSLPNNGQALDAYVQTLLGRSIKDRGFLQGLLAEVDGYGLPENRLRGLKGAIEHHLNRYGPQDTQTGPPVADHQPVERQKTIYTHWSAQEPDKALAWAEQNRRADLVENVVKQQSMNLLRSNWQPGLTEERGSPWVKGVVLQYQSWKKLDPAAADSWLKTMPADIRKHLSPSSSDAAR